MGVAYRQKRAADSRNRGSAAGMRRREFLKTTTGATAAAMTAPYIHPARAQGRNDTLLTLSESGPNNLDIMGVGTNRPGYEAAWNTHDRLVTFGSKPDANGVDHYDYTKIEPELAEAWDLGDMSAPFKLRQGVKFDDGTPVTAHDVKWSFDRAVTVGGFPSFQMRAGSLEKPEQFVAVDDRTFRIDFLRRDKFTLPDIGVPVPVVINSALAKSHASDKDPWAMEWLKTNEAGGGAFRIDKWNPGQEGTYLRFDDWRSGKLPKIQRVIWRMVPSAGNRPALIARGDADISFDPPPQDAAQLAAAKKDRKS